MNPKIISIKKAVTLKQKSKRKKWVFTNGCFDIIHYGHLTYLKAAKKLGDVLIVGLNSDGSVRKNKGTLRPINKDKHRAEILAAFEFIDFIILFSENTPLKLIQAISPDILVKGSDWKHGHIIGEEHLKSYGGKVRRIRLEPGFSTTRLIKKIKKLS